MLRKKWCEITAKEVLIECSTTELKSYNHLRDGNIQSGGNGCEIKGNGQVKKRMGICNGQSDRRLGLNESSIYCTNGKIPGKWIVEI